jgi:hypothetical protein
MRHKTCLPNSWPYNANETWYDCNCIGLHILSYVHHCGTRTWCEQDEIMFEHRKILLRSWVHDSVLAVHAWFKIWSRNWRCLAELYGWVSHIPFTLRSTVAWQLHTTVLSSTHTSLCCTPLSLLPCQWHHLLTFDCCKICRSVVSSAAWQVLMHQRPQWMIQCVTAE